MTALRMFIFAAVPVGIMIQATNGRDHAQENGVSSQHFKENITVQSGPLCRSSIGKQHSGYVQVGGSNRYFYVAIEADVHPSKAPTFVYISGGPGDSSIACVMGLNGPCLSDPTGTKQLPNPYSWTQHANGIWVDAPGPTGFSLGPVESSLENAVANL
ncbi:hypothetical protein Pmar_PMAR010600 [Perkinsus marinus ATCC 50983]|uniref:Serine carboxypeptidase n=1 Tax=Perkinsus marinus (strain ATCC 50983 / TXsc) TaxID=423536 RepID=C5KLU6_PERM5|nr:hypothetical protein Pmar_PMAR010600 [Perkinsus marinus ATCC 50983]EER14545.1 hypothetical protein Pmar_PMAR010600 [Perkinsus marinus ATCC 50983]|eukprot:XP_002782750.1 hypothetical protein Pmar_PMAR010600 [Perkinsus marinus ATCC 50983]